MSYGMVIDLRKCINCRGCAVACKEANGTPPGDMRTWVERTVEGEYPHASVKITPKLCMQCNDPACESVCPTGATWKDTESGIVFVDKSVCIGCQSCVSACPYDARCYVSDPLVGYHEEGYTEYEDAMYSQLMPGGTVDKCDFCAKRVAAGEQPACVEACMAKARHFGEISELEQSFITPYGGFRLSEEKGTNPSVWYLPVDYIEK